MQLIYILLLIGMGLAVELLDVTKPRTVIDEQNDINQAVAYNMGLYEESVRRYIRQHPGFVGTLPDQEITTLASGTYRKLEDWVSQVNANGQIITTIRPGSSLQKATSQKAIAYNLKKMRGNATTIGIAQNNYISNDERTITCTSYTSSSQCGIPLPMPVVDGSVVIYSTEK